jgi:hypothetical protein
MTHAHTDHASDAISLAEFSNRADTVFAILDIDRAGLGATYADQLTELGTRLARISSPAARQAVPLCIELAARARALGI